MSRNTPIPIVSILDDVEKCEKEVVEALAALPDGKQVRIIINSGGGSVYAGLGIATMIMAKQLQAEAIVLADCSSSALLILAACRSRKVAPHASLLFHPMRWSSEDQSRLPGAKSWATEFDRVSEVCENWLVDYLGVPRRTLRAWIREERYVQASELYELGVAEPLTVEPENVVTIAPSRRKKATRRKSADKPAARIRRVG